MDPSNLPQSTPVVPPIDPNIGNIQEMELGDIVGAYDQMGQGIDQMGQNVLADVAGRQQQLIGNNFGTPAEGPMGDYNENTYIAPVVSAARSQVAQIGTQVALKEGMRRSEEAAENALKDAQKRYNEYVAEQNRQAAEAAAKERTAFKADPVVDSIDAKYLESKGMTQDDFLALDEAQRGQMIKDSYDEARGIDWDYKGDRWYKAVEAVYKHFGITGDAAKDERSGNQSEANKALWKRKDVGDYFSSQMLNAYGDGAKILKERNQVYNETVTAIDRWMNPKTEEERSMGFDEIFRAVEISMPVKTEVERGSAQDLLLQIKDSQADEEKYNRLSSEDKAEISKIAKDIRQGKLGGANRLQELLNKSGGGGWSSDELNEYQLWKGKSWSPAPKESGTYIRQSIEQITPADVLEGLFGLDRNEMIALKKFKEEDSAEFTRAMDITAKVRSGTFITVSDGVDKPDNYWKNPEGKMQLAPAGQFIIHSVGGGHEDPELEKIKRMLKDEAIVMAISDPLDEEDFRMKEEFDKAAERYMINQAKALGIGARYETKIGSSLYNAAVYEAGGTNDTGDLVIKGKKIKDIVREWQTETRENQDLSANKFRDLVAIANKDRGYYITADGQRVDMVDAQGSSTIAAKNKHFQDYSAEEAAAVLTVLQAEINAGNLDTNFLGKGEGTGSAGGSKLMQGVTEYAALPMVGIGALLGGMGDVDQETMAGQMFFGGTENIFSNMPGEIGYQKIKDQENYDTFRKLVDVQYSGGDKEGYFAKQTDMGIAAKRFAGHLPMFAGDFVIGFGTGKLLRATTLATSSTISTRLATTASTKLSSSLAKRAAKNLGKEVLEEGAEEALMFEIKDAAGNIVKKSLNDVATDIAKLGLDGKSAVKYLKEIDPVAFKGVGQKAMEEMLSNAWGGAVGKRLGITAAARNTMKYINSDIAGITALQLSGVPKAAIRQASGPSLRAAVRLVADYGDEIVGTVARANAKKAGVKLSAKNAGEEFGAMTGRQMARELVEESAKRAARGNIMGKYDVLKFMATRGDDIARKSVFTRRFLEGELIGNGLFFMTELRDSYNPVTGESRLQDPWSVASTVLFGSALGIGGMAGARAFRGIQLQRVKGKLQNIQEYLSLNAQDVNNPAYIKAVRELDKLTNRAEELTDDAMEYAFSPDKVAEFKKTAITARRAIKEQLDHIQNQFPEQQFGRSMESKELIDSLVSKQGFGRRYVLAMSAARNEATLDYRRLTTDLPVLSRLTDRQSAKVTADAYDAVKKLPEGSTFEEQREAFIEGIARAIPGTDYRVARREAEQLMAEYDANWDRLKEAADKGHITLETYEQSKRSAYLSPAGITHTMDDDLAVVNWGLVTDRKVNADMTSGNRQRDIETDHGAVARAWADGEKSIQSGNIKVRNPKGFNLVKSLHTSNNQNRSRIYINSIDEGIVRNGDAVVIGRANVVAAVEADRAFYTKQLDTARAELKAIKASMKGAGDDIDPEAVTPEITAATKVVADIEKRLEVLNGTTITNKIRQSGARAAGVTEREFTRAYNAVEKRFRENKKAIVAGDGVDEAVTRYTQPNGDYTRENVLEAVFDEYDNTRPIYDAYGSTEEAASQTLKGIDDLAKTTIELRLGKGNAYVKEILGRAMRHFSETDAGAGVYGLGDVVEYTARNTPLSKRPGDGLDSLEWRFLSNRLTREGSEERLAQLIAQNEEALTTAARQAQQSVDVASIFEQVGIRFPEGTTPTINMARQALAELPDERRLDASRRLQELFDDMDVPTSDPTPDTLLLRALNEDREYNVRIRGSDADPDLDMGDGDIDNAGFDDTADALADTGKQLNPIESAMDEFLALPKADKQAAIDSLSKQLEDLPDAKYYKDNNLEAPEVTDAMQNRQFNLAEIVARNNIEDPDFDESPMFDRILKPEGGAASKTTPDGSATSYFRGKKLPDGTTVEWGEIQEALRNNRRMFGEFYPDPVFVNGPASNPRSGGFVLGSYDYVDDLISLSTQGADIVGTGYHESIHRAIGQFLEDAEIQELYTDVLVAAGGKRKLREIYGNSYSGNWKVQAEEHIANAFREYKAGRLPNYERRGAQKRTAEMAKKLNLPESIIRIFDNLFDRMQSFVYGSLKGRKASRENLINLFERLDEGEFASRVPDRTGARDAVALNRHKTGTDRLKYSLNTRVKAAADALKARSNRPPVYDPRSNPVYVPDRYSYDIAQAGDGTYKEGRIKWGKRYDEKKNKYVDNWVDPAPLTEAGGIVPGARPTSTTAPGDLIDSNYPTKSRVPKEVGMHNWALTASAEVNNRLKKVLGKRAEEYTVDFDPRSAVGTSAESGFDEEVTPFSIEIQRLLDRLHKAARDGDISQTELAKLDVMSGTPGEAIPTGGQAGAAAQSAQSIMDDASLSADEKLARLTTMRSGMSEADLAASTAPTAVSSSRRESENDIRSLLDIQKKGEDVLETDFDESLSTRSYEENLLTKEGSARSPAQDDVPKVSRFSRFMSETRGEILDTDPAVVKRELTTARRRLNRAVKDRDSSVASQIEEIENVTKANKDKMKELRKTMSDARRKLDGVNSYTDGQAYVNRNGLKFIDDVNGLSGYTRLRVLLESVQAEKADSKNPISNAKTRRSNKKEGAVNLASIEVRENNYNDIIRRVQGAASDNADDAEVRVTKAMLAADKEGKLKDVGAGTMLRVNDSAADDALLINSQDVYVHEGLANIKLMEQHQFSSRQGMQMAALKFAGFNKAIQNMQLSAGYSMYNAYSFRWALSAMMQNPGQAGDIIKTFADARNMQQVASFFGKNQELITRVTAVTGDNMYIDAFVDSHSVMSDYSSDFFTRMRNSWKDTTYKERYKRLTRAEREQIAKERGYDSWRNAPEFDATTAYAGTKNPIGHAADTGAKWVELMWDSPTFQRYIPVLQATLLTKNYDLALKRMTRAVREDFEKGLRDTPELLEKDINNVLVMAHIRTKMFFYPNAIDTTLLNEFKMPLRGGAFDSAAKGKFFDNLDSEMVKEITRADQGKTMSTVLRSLFFALGYKATQIGQILNGLRGAASPGSFVLAGSRNQVATMVGLAAAAFVFNEMNDRQTAFDDPEKLFLNLNNLGKFRLGDGDGTAAIDPFFSQFTLFNATTRSLYGMANLEGGTSTSNLNPHRGFGIPGTSIYKRGELPLGLTAVQDEMVSMLLSPYKAATEVVTNNTYFGNNIWEHATKRDGSANANYNPLRNIGSSVMHMLNLQSTNAWVKGDNAENDRIGITGGSGLLSHPYLEMVRSYNKGDYADALFTAMELPVKWDNLSSPARTSLNGYVVKSIASYKDDYDAKVVEAKGDANKIDEAYKTYVQQSVKTINDWSERYGDVLEKNPKLVSAAQKILTGFMSGEYDDNLNKMQSAYWKARIDSQMGDDFGWDMKAGETEEEFAERKDKTNTAYYNQLDEEYKARQMLESEGFKVEGFGYDDMMSEYRNTHRNVIAQFEKAVKGKINGFPNLAEQKKNYQMRIGNVDEIYSSSKKAREKKTELANENNKVVMDLLTPYVEQYGPYTLDMYDRSNKRGLADMAAEYIIVPAEELWKYGLSKTPEKNYLKDQFGVGYKNNSNLPSDVEFKKKFDTVNKRLQQGQTASASTLLDRIIKEVNQGKYGVTGQDWGRVVRYREIINGRLGV